MYSNILAAFFGTHWAATPEYTMAAMEFADKFLLNRESLRDIQKENEEAYAATFANATRIGKTGSDPIMLLENGTAVVPIQGMIVPKSGNIGLCMQGTSMDRLKASAEMLQRNPAVKNVVLNIHSGGGSVLGVPEAADAIKELAKVKPVTASINMVAGSAAYWLASAANKRFITKSGIAGSIGVYAIVANQAERLKKEGIDARILRAGKFKAMPNGLESFTKDDPGLKMVQDGVDRIHTEFTEVISTNLNITMAEATELANGTTKTGQEAIEAGLADEMGDLNDALAQAGSKEDDSTKASLEDPVTNVTEARAEEIVESNGDASEELAKGDVDGVHSDNIESDVLASSEDLDAIVAENEELKVKLDAAEKALADKAQSEESEKINSVIATATQDGRIALQKADEMRELAAEIGVENFTKMVDAIPVPAKLEDLSTIPAASDEANDSDDGDDEFAPLTASEKELYAQSPALAKKYNLWQ